MAPVCGGTADQSRVNGTWPLYPPTSIASCRINQRSFRPSTHYGIKNKQHGGRRCASLWGSAFELVSICLSKSESIGSPANGECAKENYSPRQRTRLALHRDLYAMEKAMELFDFSFVYDEACPSGATFVCARRNMLSILKSRLQAFDQERTMRPFKAK